jgi:hypothetical protein
MNFFNGRLFPLAFLLKFSVNLAVLFEAVLYLDALPNFSQIYSQYEHICSQNSYQFRTHQFFLCILQSALRIWQKFNLQPHFMIMKKICEFLEDFVKWNALNKLEAIMLYSQSLIWHFIEFCSNPFLKNIHELSRQTILRIFEKSSNFILSLFSLFSFFLILI